jgi:hypothetical protein
MLGADTHFVMASAIVAPVVNDPLLTGVPLEHEAIFYPYGFPTRILSNSACVLEAAERSWGAYRRKFDDAPLEIRLALSDSDSPACFEPPVSRSQGHLVAIVADRENFACLDLNAGFAFGWATEGTVRNQDYFRECLLDALIYPLLEIRLRPSRSGSQTPESLRGADQSSMSEIVFPKNEL